MRTMALHWRGLAWPRHALLLALLAGLMLVLATPRAAFAAEQRSGDTVVVGPGETVNDDLYVFGQTVEVQGRVNGDVIAFGNTVTISGRVTGDVIAAGATVNVPGIVGGSIRAAGQTLAITGPVGEDLVAGAGSLSLGSAARVGRDVLFGAGNATLSGPIGRSILAGSESLTIAAPVGGDVRAEVGSLRLADGAAIAGGLTYRSRQEATMEPGATVRGTVAWDQREGEQARPGPASRVGSGLLDWLRGLIGIAALGLLLVLPFPGFSRGATETLRAAPWASLGLGFAFLVGVPVAAVLLFVVGLVVGGWWLALAALGLCTIALPVGYAVGGLFVGQTALRLAGRPDAPLYAALLAGLALLAIIAVVPIAGGIAVFLALTFGVGALLQALTATYRARQAAVAA